MKYTPAAYTRLDDEKPTPVLTAKTKRIYIGSSYTIVG